MRNAKWIAFLLSILALIFIASYSATTGWTGGLKMLATIFGLILCAVLVWGMQVWIDDVADNRYNRKFPLPDNLLVFPGAS